MWRDTVIPGALLLLPGVLIEALVFASLISPVQLLTTPLVWLIAHSVASLMVAAGTMLLVARLSEDRPWWVFALAFVLGIAMPFVGAVGTSSALLVGMWRAINRHRETCYWQFTSNPDLPFTTPIGREAPALDGRGFAEQLAHDPDSDGLYRKVLAAGRMRTSLSVEALTAAIAHADDRVRLTAYQTLDRKVTRLNADIQRLEEQVANKDPDAQSDTWLQIASNYWELLTIEQGEAVAREQLLDKAFDAAREAILARHDNRNAHFTLGRIALRQGQAELASAAFRCSLLHGMPQETIIPYMAEAAFDQRDFKRVSELLASLDAAFRHYPPLRQLAAQWT